MMKHTILYLCICGAYLCVHVCVCACGNVCMCVHLCMCTCVWLSLSLSPSPFSLSPLPVSLLSPLTRMHTHTLTDLPALCHLTYLSVWDSMKKTYSFKAKEHTAPVWTLEFHPKLPWLVSGAADSLVIVWSLEHGRSVERHEKRPDRHDTKNGRSSSSRRRRRRDGKSSDSHDEPTHDHDDDDDNAEGSLDPDDMTSEDDDNDSEDGNSDHQQHRFVQRKTFIRVIDPCQSRVLKRLRVHPHTVFCCKFSPSGDIMATGCGDGIVRIFSVPDLRVQREFTGHRGYVRCLLFTPDGQDLFSGGGDRSI